MIPKTPIIRRTLLLILAAFFSAACQNPLIEQMQTQVQTDVTVARDGELTVLSTTPVDGETDVSLTIPFTAVFSQDMNANNLEGSISLRTGGTEISGTTTYESETKSVIFAPEESLSAAVQYTVEVNSGALESAAGISLERNYTVQFTTSGRPVVESVFPGAGATAVAVDVNPTVVFDRPMSPGTAESSVSLSRSDGQAVTGAVTYNDASNRVTVSPDDDLDVETNYVLTIEADASSLSGATVGETLTYAFTTDFYRPDDIAVSVNYGGPYELSAQFPIYLAFIPNPYSPGGPVHEIKINAEERVVVNRTDLPATGPAGDYWLVLTHDFSEDYQNWFDGASVSTAGLYSSAATDNFTTDFFAVVSNTGTGEDPKFEASTHGVVSPGNSYSLTFTDTELVSSDSSEPNEDWPDADAIAELGPAYSKTMGWEDTDWFAFTPDVTDEYRLVVANDVDSPYDESSLVLDFPVQLSVFRYESGSDDVSHKGSDYDDSGIDTDNYGLLDVDLVAGETYFVRVTSVAKADVGEYKIKVVPTEVAQDIDEPGNDTYVAGGGRQIPFGQTNYLQRSLHFLDTSGLDTDYFWIDDTDFRLSAPGEGMPVYFVVETSRPDFESVPDLTIGMSLREGASSGGSQYSGGYLRLIYPNEYYTSLSPGRKDVRIQNESYNEYYIPTGAYWISFAYGPDVWDWDRHNSQYWANRDNTIGATADMDSIAAGDATSHSIYDTDDVDFIRVWTGESATITHLTVYLSLPAAYTDTVGTGDDFYADMDIYDSGQSLMSSNVTADGESSIEIYVGDQQSDYTDYIYLRLYKADNSPLPTGAYKIEVTDTSP